MKRRISAFAAAIALAAALGVAPAAAQHSSRGHYYAFTCTSNTVLRVRFDDEAGTARVMRIRQPTITLRRAESSDGFRYTRGSTHELRGTLEEVRWRVGRSEWVCAAGAT